MRRLTLLLALVATHASAASAPAFPHPGLLAALPASAQTELCFNQLQVLATHNSYHQAPPQEITGAFGALAGGLLGAWQYSHPPLSAQLAAGVRAFELDVHADPEGGLYGQAAGLRLAGAPGWLSDERYQRPGFKVLHIPDFDFRSSCILLAECLAEVKACSDANPSHLPIRLYIEVKGPGQVEGLGASVATLLQTLLDASPAEGPDSFVQVPPTTAQTFQQLQAELLAAFSPNSTAPSGTSAAGATSGHGQLLTPDDVRAALGAPPGADLRQLLLRPPTEQPCPWPPLASLRGKVLAVLVLYGGTADVAALEEAYPDLVGSLMWVEQGSPTPAGQSVFRSEAVSRLSSGDSLASDLPADADAQVAALAAEVRAAVAEGYLVRSRTDADTVEARAGYTARRDAIIAAGPQVVASDFVLPAALQCADDGTPLLPSPPTDYNVTLPGALEARCLSGSPSDGTTSAPTAPAADGRPTDGVWCGPLEAAPPGRVRLLDGGGGGGGQGSAAPLPPASLPPPPETPRAGDADSSGVGRVDGDSGGAAPSSSSIGTPLSGSRPQLRLPACLLAATAALAAQLAAA